MSQKYQILFSLFSPEKIEVNRYPNRRKSPRITGCGWPQSWDKISVFLPIWGITKGLLKESAETLKKAKNITRSQTTKKMQKPLDRSRIIPTETDCVISYHHFNTSVEPKAKSNSDDRFFVGISKHKEITKEIGGSQKYRSSELDFAFGSTEVLK